MNINITPAAVTVQPNRYRFIMKDVSLNVILDQTLTVDDGRSYSDVMNLLKRLAIEYPAPTEVGEVTIEAWYESPRQTIATIYPTVHWRNI